MIYTLEISYATKSKDGRLNQDNLIVDKYVSSCSELSYTFGYLVTDTREKCLFAVSDGAGGGLLGEMASAITVKTLSDNLDKIKNGITPSDLFAALDDANLKVVNFYRNYDDIGAATVSGLLFDNGNLCIFNIGDSPIYAVKDGKINTLHQEHTLAAEKYDGEENAKVDINSVEANTLTCYIGDSFKKASLCVYSAVVPVESATTYIITSDGVEKGLSEKEIMKISSKNDCVARKIVDKAYKRHADDDITAIVIKIH